MASTSDHIPEVEEIENGLFCVGEIKFASHAAAERHQAMLLTAKAINRILPHAIDPDREFKNGAGYIQHNPALVALFRDALVSAVARNYSEEYAEHLKDHPYDDFTVMRVLSDTESPLFEIWDRGRRIDSDSREWGQKKFGRSPLNPCPMEGCMQEWKEVEI